MSLGSVGMALKWFVLSLWKGELQQQDLNPVPPAQAFLPEEDVSPENDLQ